MDKIQGFPFMGREFREFGNSLNQHMGWELGNLGNLQSLGVLKEFREFPKPNTWGWDQGI